MCDFTKGFILCSCNKKKKVSRNKKTQKSNEYIWILNRFLGETLEKEIGRYLLPVCDIGDGLTSDMVLNHINHRNCFDFHYVPSEGDNLVFRKPNSFIRLEFIFRNGKWEEDHYSPFENIKEVEKGKVTTLDNK